MPEPTFSRGLGRIYFKLHAAPRDGEIIFIFNYLPEISAQLSSMVASNCAYKLGVDICLPKI
jgi:hypothetical protein